MGACRKVRYERVEPSMKSRLQPGKVGQLGIGMRILYPGWEECRRFWHSWVERDSIQESSEKRRDEIPVGPWVRREAWSSCSLCDFVSSWKVWKVPVVGRQEGSRWERDQLPVER